MTREELFKKLGVDSFYYRRFRQTGITMKGAIAKARRFEEERKNLSEKIKCAQNKEEGKRYRQDLGHLYATIPASVEYNPPNESNGFRWIEKASRGLRVSEISKEGFYIDSFCSEYESPAVIQIPARKGVPQYLAAITDAYNDDCFLVDFSELFDEKEDAMRRAQGLTERHAEESREYDSAYQAGRTYAENLEVMGDLRKKALQILSGRREARSAKVSDSCREILCGALQEGIQNILAEIRRLRKENQKLAEGQGIGRDCDFSFYTGEKRLREAFNEGAAKVVLA